MTHLQPHGNVTLFREDRMTTLSACGIVSVLFSAALAGCVRYSTEPRYAAAPYDQPAYNTPQPVYSTPPAYAAPPVYAPAPVNPPPPAVARVSDPATAASHVKYSLSNMFALLSEGSPSDFALLRRQMQDLDGRVDILQDSIAHREGLGRVRSDFSNVQGAAAIVDGHMRTVGGYPRVHDAWAQVEGSLQETANALSVR